MATTLDTRRIRRCTPSQLRDYYKEIQHDISEDDRTLQILGAIKSGSVAPFPTYATWLGVTKSPSALQSGLQQNFSVIVRAYSIEQLGKEFCSTRWKSALNRLGGSLGLLSLFINMSVNEVRDACRALGKCGRGNDVLEKRSCITELFMGLQPQLFPDARVKTTDRRPLGRYYRHLIPSCSEKLVERIVSGDLRGKWKPVRDEYLMQLYPIVMRREQLRALNGEPGIRLDQRRFQGLVTLYPQGLDTTPGFSPSMEFALGVLRDSSHGAGEQLDDEIFIHDLVRPLLRRAIKKKIDWSKIREIVDLAMQYLETHPSAGKEISITQGDVLHLVALCWANQPEMFEKQLRRLCSDPVFGTSTHDQLTEWDDFVNGIPRHRRYALLQLCFFESTELDLDSDMDLKKVKGCLRDDLLDALRPEEALSLFTRLRAARGDNDLVTVSAENTILSMEPSYNTSRSDVDLYHVMLLGRNRRIDDARNLATKQLEERKKKAEKASAPEQRAFYANSAVYYGIASGDLQVYQSVLDWTKRFIRDPQVLPTLYSRYEYPREVITLLSGIPQGHLDLAASEVQARVCLSNAVLQNMFDTACSAIREPSFQVYDWQGTLRLFQQVVQERIKRSDLLQQDLAASDEEMYDLLWEDTLRMLLAVEVKANRSESVRLEANTVRGPLGWQDVWKNERSDYEPETQKKYTYSFFDNLAKARDKYWRKQRSTVHPAVLTLPESLTRGLPIQFLTPPWVLRTPNLELLAPYIASRARAILFQDPSVALRPVTDDEELLEAIGMFVDSYQYALRLYVPDSCSKDEQARRIQEVWNHAVGPLSQGRMNEEEAVRWWQNKVPNHLKKHLSPHEENDTTHVTWPLIPDVEDPNQPTEWNPFEAGRPNHPKRDLGKLTYLDLSVLILDETPNIAQIWTKSRLIESVPTVLAHEVDTRQIWHPWRNMGEGGVLSALLYLEMMHGAPNGRLLQKPFPSAADARYPSLYLDDGFRGDPLNQFNAARHIRGHIDSVPPALLHLSTQNMMTVLWALDQYKRDDDSVQELALTLLVRLSESDRPSLSQNLALQIIIGRPEASSWHRQLLKLSYLRRLSNEDAKACCERVAKAVLARMPTNGDTGRALRGETEDSIADSFVKVTTIKLLAQQLRDADFVEEDFTFSVLSILLERAIHPDVRVNTAETLLNMFQTCSSELADKILVALETLIPLAGNLNESKPVTESDWKLAEETLNLPEYPGIDDSLLLFELFVKHYSGASSSERHPVFVERLLLPTFAHRQHQIKRWLLLFLKKHGVDETNLLVPRIPERATVLLTGDAACYLPRTMLEDFVSYIEFKIVPPPPIQALHKRLRGDPVMLKRPDVQTWFSLFGSGADGIYTFRGFDILSLFDKSTKLSQDIGITSQVIQEQFLKTFKAALWADAPKYERLSGNLLANLLRGKYLTKPWWATHGKYIVKEMVAYIDSIRTKSWLTDPNRMPAVLPDTFPWQLLLLDFPWPRIYAMGEDKCREFIRDLATIVHEISTVVYHKKLQQLKDHLALDPVSSTNHRNMKMKQIGRYTIHYQRRDHVHDQLMRNRLIVALDLGRVSTERSAKFTAAEILRVEVASYLLGLVEDVWKEVADKELQEKVKERVEHWKTCYSEDIRGIGYGLDWLFK